MAREIYSRNWDRMSFDEQREYRDRKLSYFVRTQLYPYSPFYRKSSTTRKSRPSDIRRVEDLRKLPFTYKADIAPDARRPRPLRQVRARAGREVDRGVHAADAAPQDCASTGCSRARTTSRRRLWREYAPVHLQFTTGRTGLPTPIMYARSDMERMAEAGRRIIELAGFGTSSTARTPSC